MGNCFNCGNRDNFLCMYMQVWILGYKAIKCVGWVPDGLTDHIQQISTTDDQNKEKHVK